VQGKTRKGSYILVINLPLKQSIKVGGLGEIQFNAGWYAYVGSAMGGLKPRLLHYIRGPEKPHWHIDYLLQVADLRDIVTCENEVRTECKTAQVMMSQLEYVPGFGCSDCKYKSH